MTTRNAASMGDFGSTWTYGGYAGQGNVSDLLGTLKGRVAVVVGGAADVLIQLASLQGSTLFEYGVHDIYKEAVIFAVNDIGMFLPKVDHWVSLHGKNLGAWKTVRWLHVRERELTKYHTTEEYAYTDYNWQSLTPMFVLSGYFAMQIAYIMGAEQIILCGCPGDATPRFFDLPGQRREAGQFVYNEEGVWNQLEHEMKRLPDFKAKVRSMSGMTRAFFGGV